MKNIFNLKAVGESIINFFIEHYNLLLDKIAIHSRAYNNLHNDYNEFLTTNFYLPDIRNTLESAHCCKLVKKLLEVPGLVNHLNEFDSYIIRNTESNDLLIVENDLEKHNVLEEMSHFSGVGQVITFKELLQPYTQIRVPVGRIYVFSSIWLNDLIKLENVLYKLNSSKEGSKI